MENADELLKKALTLLYGAAETEGFERLLNPTNLAEAAYLLTPLLQQSLSQANEGNLRSNLTPKPVSTGPISASQNRDSSPTRRPSVVPKCLILYFDAGKRSSAEVIARAITETVAIASETNHIRQSECTRAIEVAEQRGIPYVCVMNHTTDITLHSLAKQSRTPPGGLPNLSLIDILELIRTEEIFLRQNPAPQAGATGQWELYHTEDGNPFWYNTETDESSWYPPAATKVSNTQHPAPLQIPSSHTLQQSAPLPAPNSTPPQPPHIILAGAPVVALCRDGLWYPGVAVLATLGGWLIRWQDNSTEVVPIDKIHPPGFDPHKPTPLPRSDWVCSHCRSANNGPRCQRCGSPSPSPQSLPTVQQPPQTSWFCSRCHAVNPTVDCPRCRQVPAALPVDWNCPNCRRLNPANRTDCLQCRARKPIPLSQAPPSQNTYPPSGLHLQHPGIPPRGPPLRGIPPPGAPPGVAAPHHALVPRLPPGPPPRGLPPGNPPGGVPRILHRPPPVKSENRYSGLPRPHFVVFYKHADKNVAVRQSWESVPSQARSDLFAFLLAIRNEFKLKTCIFSIHRGQWQLTKEIHFHLTTSHSTYYESMLFQLGDARFIDLGNRHWEILDATFSDKTKNKFWQKDLKAAETNAEKAPLPSQLGAHPTLPVPVMHPRIPVEWQKLLIPHPYEPRLGFPGPFTAFQEILHGMMQFENWMQIAFSNPTIGVHFVVSLGQTLEPVDYFFRDFNICAYMQLEPPIYCRLLANPRAWIKGAKEGNSGELWT